MDDFSADQIKRIATGYRNLARSLNEFQVTHWPSLLVDQHVDLNAYQSSLLNRAQDLQTRLVRPAFVSPRDTTAQIKQATDLAKKSLKKIKSLPVALNIGAIVVALTSYVARADPRGIQVALRELNELVQLG